MSTILVDKADKASVTVIGSTDDRLSFIGLFLLKWKDRIGLLVYVIVQFFAFFFVVFGTPMDMFRLRFVFDPNLVVVTTLWGVKVGVFDTEYALTNRVMWSNCTERRDRFYLAQGLAIFSILIYGTAFVLGFIMLYCCSFFRWICLALNIVGAATLSVVWGAMVVTYTTDEGPFCPEQKRYHTYGSGFALFVSAWVLDFLNIVSLLLPF